MSDDDSTLRADETPSIGAYLRLVFLNPISIVGIVLTAVGIALVSLSSPGGVLGGPLPAAGLMLFGIIVFALGYTRAQRVMKRRGWS
jgi:drug/metabolite transporter (DMT)-like permease